MTALELLRRRASDYELLAEWHVERSAGDPRYGDAADALVAVAIVLRLMERVRDLSWDTQFEAIPEKAPSGLEPLYEALQASA